MARSLIILAIIVSLLAVSGCLSYTGRPQATPTPVVPTPTPVPQPSITIPVPSPGTTVIWTPGSNGTPSSQPGPIGQAPSASPTLVPVISGTADNWGTSKSTYARGDTATGWVDVTNTGNVPITTVDFFISIKRTVFFMPVEKSYDYSQTGLNIQPGQTQRVEFSQSIPSEYSGVSTAGDYKLTVTAKLDGNEIGSYSSDLKIV